MNMREISSFRPEVAEGRHYPSHLTRRRRLPNGIAVVVRHAIDKDKDYVPFFLCHQNTKDLVTRFMERPDQKKERIVGVRSRPDRLQRDYVDVLDYVTHTTIIVQPHEGEPFGYAHSFHTGNGVYECAFARQSALSHMGIGSILMDAVLEWARATDRVQELEAIVLRENEPMRNLFLAFEFTEHPVPDDHTTVEYRLKIR